MGFEEFSQTHIYRLGEEEESESKIKARKGSGMEWFKQIANAEERDLLEAVLQPLPY